MKEILFGTLCVDKFNTNTWAQFFLLALQEVKLKAGISVVALLRQETPDYFLNVMCRGTRRENV